MESTHISGVNIAGNVNIGKFCWIGIGSQIIQNIHIGDNVTVGGGSLVLKDIPKNLKVFGSPINVIKETNKNEFPKWPNMKKMKLKRLRES